MTLTAENLSCIRQERQIFQGVNFTLQPGQMIWVKGRNGAGKSSLLRIAAQLLKPASGALNWNGTAIHEEPEAYQGSFEFIGHQDALKTAMTPRENLQFWATYRGSSSGSVDAAIEAFELPKIADFPVQNLSAGQKKRSNLARLIACPAPLWILDEPISSLDHHYIECFRTLLGAHLKSGGMVLLATHQDLNMPGVDLLDLDKVGEANS